MLGHFLEISVHSGDVLESLRFYERLGFTQVRGNDTWTHPYGVVTDGRCFIGIHAFTFPAPALTFVAPELRGRVEALEAAGAVFEFLKLGDDQFHELGFYLPDEQMITLLEARTFSPPDPAGLRDSLLGFFMEYRLPVDDREGAAARWLAFGFIDNEPTDTLHNTASLCRTGLNVGLTESRRLRQPALVFHAPDLPASLERLRQLQVDAVPLRNAGGELLAAQITAPEGTRLLAVRADSPAVQG